MITEETLWSQAENVRERSRGASQQEIADAFAALTVAWFAWELSLSERQAVEVLHFFADRSPEAIPAVKRTFVAWFEALWK